MPIEAAIIYKSKDQIVADLIAALLARVPDINTEEDSNIRLLCEVMAGEIEGVFLANQILRDNIFVQSANLTELRRHGEQFGLPIKTGTVATGSVRFSGAGGTFIPAGAVIGADPGAGDVLYFVTTADATIPNPGIPTAPTAAAGGVGTNLNPGTYEYAVTFVTDGGETVIGVESSPVVLAANGQINLTNIPVGGTGTTARKIYRSVDGGDYQLVTTLSDNVTTTFNDNVDEASLGANPPAESTAERVTTTAESEEGGTAYNVEIGAINEVADVPDGVTDVTNTTVFTGGTDEEDMEAFRSRLLDFLRNPKTGSPADLEAWAEAIDGVAEATAFPNDNLGTPTNGHVTVRIVGPDGTTPPQSVIDAVQAELDAQDIANIVIHVTTFDSVSTDVTVDVDLESTFTLGDVTPAVKDAIEDYINAVPVGGTVYRAGIIDAVFGLAGIINVTVSTPATDQTSTATQKRVPGTITVA